MKEINSKRIIGRVRSRKNMFVWLLLFVGGSAYALWSVFGIFDVYSVSKLPFYMGSVHFVYVFQYILAFGLIWVMVGTMLFLGSNQFIQIDETHLSYCEAKGLRGKMKQFINSMLKRKQSFDLQVRISEIKKIRLSFSDDYFWFVLKGHTLIYDIELHDGTMIRLLPDNLRLNKENCLAGIEYMRELGIVLEDPFDIIDALKDKKVMLGEYFDRLERDHVS